MIDAEKILNIAQAEDLRANVGGRLTLTGDVQNSIKGANNVPIASVVTNVNNAGADDYEWADDIHH